MRKLHHLRSIAVTLAVVGLPAAASGASASELRILPSVPATDGTSALAKSPGSITFGCCDPPTFAGTRLKSPIRWKSWTPKTALGIGAMWVDPCHPYCAAQDSYPLPATLRLSDPQKLGGHLVFRKITITYTTRKHLSWLKRATVAYKLLTGSGPHGPDYYFRFP